MRNLAVLTASIGVAAFCCPALAGGTEARADIPKPPLSADPARSAEWLEMALVDNPRVRVAACGQTSEGRTIQMVAIQDECCIGDPVPRIAILCRQHGDEPEATDAGLELIYRLSSMPDEKWQAYTQVAIVIVPIANPDGSAALQRRNSDGSDLNRDWGHQRTPEIRALTDMLHSLRPKLVIDVHQWVPGDSCQTPLAEAAGGALANQIVSEMHHDCAVDGLALAPRRWLSGADSLCHRYYGAAQHIPAILLETRHVPGDPNARTAAIETTCVALLAAIRHISLHAGDAGHAPIDPSTVLDNLDVFAPKLVKPQVAANTAVGAHTASPDKRNEITLSVRVVQVSRADKAMVVEMIPKKASTSDAQAPALQRIVQTDGAVFMGVRGGMTDGPLIDQIAAGDRVEVTGFAIGTSGRIQARTIEIVNETD